MSKNVLWAQNMVIRPQAPKVENVDFFTFSRIVLLIRFQRALKHYHTTILSQVINFFPLIVLKGFLDTLGSPCNSVSYPYRTPCLTTTVIELNFSPTVTYGIVCLWYQFERKRISISDFKETLS